MGSIILPGKRVGRLASFDPPLGSKPYPPQSNRMEVDSLGAIVSDWLTIVRHWHDGTAGLLEDRPNSSTFDHG